MRAAPSARKPGAFSWLVAATVVAASLTALASPAAAQQTWTISVILQSATSLSDDDTWGEDDIYWKARVIPTVGVGAPADCDFIGQHTDDDNHITPGWTCTTTVTGAPDTAVQIVLELWEHDSTSADDHFDIHPSPGEMNIVATYRPSSFGLTMNVGGWESPRCPPGAIQVSGFNGDDRAAISFAVSSSLAGAPNGDSDGDGLLDSQEVCGIDQNADGIVDVDLRGMGARPERKDAFVEIDWMVDNSGIVATQHSHEPWLPALTAAWNEFNAAPVTNPTTGAIPTQSGIALHLDVGTLYAGYAMDFDGNGTVDLTVPATGNLDLDGDGIADLGNLGALGTGTPGGGNALAEDAVLAQAGGDTFGVGSDFQVLKAINFNALRGQAFRYTIFGHRYGTAANGSSGQAESCGSPECDDFIVTLGGWPRETIDADRDAVPDFGGPLLRGPSALAVDGRINDHVGTFLHELGHTVALGHGGADGVNWKPNYLSIMNYNWQVSGLSFDFNGDRLGDPVAVDFDRNGLVDLRRFQYSSPALPALNEANLGEPAGIGDANTLTIHSCPAPFGTVTARGAGPIDWNCNGNATEAGITVDVNAADGSGITVLTGFDDYARIAAGGLEFQRGISLDELRALENRTQRIVPLPGRYRERQLCDRPRTIDFESLAAGTKVDTQFAPLATFLRDGERTPTIADPPMRGGVPTASPKNSLINVLRGEKFAPLVVEFGAPQRAVTLFFGRTQAATPMQDFRGRAVLQAFDVNGLSMGEVTVPLPTLAEGVTKPLTAAAVFPDQLIRRIELRYEMGVAMAASMLWAPLPEPQQIDDLTACATLPTDDIVPSLPKQPSFGDLRVKVELAAVRVQPDAGPHAGEPGHSPMVESPLPGVPVTVDAATHLTTAVIQRAEGTKIVVAAPPTFAGATFQEWRLDGTVSFGTGKREIELTLLRDGALTAVYGYQREKPRPPKEPPCDCPEKRRDR